MPRGYRARRQTISVYAAYLEATIDQNMILEQPTGFETAHHFYYLEHRHLYVGRKNSSIRFTRAILIQIYHYVSDLQLFILILLDMQGVHNMGLSQTAAIPTLPSIQNPTLPQLKPVLLA